MRCCGAVGCKEGCEGGCMEEALGPFFAAHTGEEEVGRAQHIWGKGGQPVEVITCYGATKRHIQMGVRIDSSRHDQLSSCIYDSGMRRCLLPRAPLGKPSSCMARKRILERRLKLQRLRMLGKRESLNLKSVATHGIFCAD